MQLRNWPDRFRLTKAPERVREAVPARSGSDHSSGCPRTAAWTAAAVAALQILDALDDETGRRTAHFLAQMQTDEGGMRANTRIPIADLLSTFTGLLTLGDLGALEMIDDAAALRYARSLKQPSGGFFGAAWDEQADVEYTFYGIGACALLTVAQHDQ